MVDGAAVVIIVQDEGIGRIEFIVRCFSIFFLAVLCDLEQVGVAYCCVHFYEIFRLLARHPWPT